MIILFAMAMTIELNHLLKHFPGISEYKLGEYTYYQTKFQEKIIYFLLTGVGSLNTAISLSKFLSKIKPDIIINAGTSGGHDKKLNVGDIILAKEVINMNSIETIFKGENEGSDSLTWKLKTFSEDAENQDFIEEYLKKEKELQQTKNDTIKEE